jgi:peptidoglycan/LPS O-acetylase OafA/YrhL
MQTPFSHRADIDGLRAIAVAVVVLFHVGIPGITGGFVGVDVFFVISGFLITSLLVAEGEKRGRISLADFYARRIRRIFPALLLVILATLALGAFCLLPVFSEQTNLAKSAVATSLYISNFYFWRYTGGYFAGATELVPLLHTWSLAVEEQFYIFWPVLLIAILKLSSRDMQRFRTNVLRVIVPLALLSFAINIWSTDASPQAAYYLLPSRAWELAIGGIIALALPKQPDQSPLWGGILSAAGIAAIVFSAFWLTNDSAFPGYNALWPTLGAGAVIVGGALSTRSFSTRLLSTKPMTYIGLLSYSWYLWHWPLLSLTRNVVLREENLLRDALIGGVLSFALASLTYHFIEDPVRKKRPGPFMAVPSTLWTGAAISIVMAGASLALALSAKYIGSQNARYAEATFARYDAPPLRNVCNHTRSNHLTKLPDRARCTIGDPNHITAVLWGDSHADHYSSLIQAFIEQRKDDEGILQRSFSACSPMAEQAQRAARPSKACLAFNQAVLEELAQLKAQGLKGVVLSSFWNAVFGVEGDYFRKGNFSSAEEKHRYAEAAANDLITRLTAMGLKVLIVGPITRMSRPVPECLARYSLEDCSETREDIDAERKPALDALRRIAAAHPHSVQLWDPVEGLCDSEWCPVRMGSVIMFTDAVHLTASGARQLLGSADPHLNWLVSDDPHATAGGPAHVAKQ